MNDNKKEIRRIRLEDLDSSLQNILLNRISKDDPAWKKIQDLIDDLYKKTHNEKKNITITINQSDNQTIHVYVPQKNGGVDHTSTFTCLAETTYEAEVIAENGYKAGTLNVSKSGAFTNNKTINATPATVTNATVTIVQSDNQTIHVYTPKKEGGTDHTSTFTCPVGTTYEAEVIAETGYTAGSLNVGNSGTINNDMTINANPASKAQIYIAKGSAPWYYSKWIDASHIIKTDETISGQATVTCEGVTSMNSMFEDCHSLTSLNLSNFDTSKITDMNHMFYSCRNLTLLDISNFNTSKVTDMAYMFNYCRSLASIDVSSFNTSNVTNMYAMFEYCSNLTSLDLSNFDTSNATDMGYMFRYCSSLTSIKGMIDMKHCESYVDMFYDCPKLRDVKIKNPPSGFNGAGLNRSQYTLY